MLLLQLLKLPNQPTKTKTNGTKIQTMETVPLSGDNVEVMDSAVQLAVNQVHLANLLMNGTLNVFK